jgi:protoporphyrinogen/coproporphyrinogen III oxidase
MSARARVIVVGGGMTGLATAWRLREHAEVRLLERGVRLGGVVHTIAFDGTAFDVGADAYLIRQRHAARLVRDLGLGGAAVAAAPARVLIHDGRRTAPLPSVTVMGVPTRPGPLLGSPLLSVPQRMRAAAGTLVPRRPPRSDRNVADLVGRRYGRAVVDALVEPLLGGVHAGHAARLSAEVTLPQVFGVRGRLTPPRRTGVPIFETVRGGLARVVDRLAADLEDRVLTGAEVAAVVGGDAAGVRLADGRMLEADAVVLAVPADAASALLEVGAPRTATLLRRVRSATVATVALAYEDATPPDATGLLVTRGAGLLVKAVTLSTRKWPHLADHPRMLVRASVGRIDEDLEPDDDVLAAQVDAEVAQLLDLTSAADRRAVQRWPGALPQYEVGHRTLVARIRTAIAEEAPGIIVAGAGLDGVGLAARCREAEEISEALRRRPGRA